MFYKNGTLATQISWTAPTQYVDGSAYGDADHAGYELGVDGAAFVAVPAVYNVTSWPLAELNLGYGTFSLTLRTVTKTGLVSDWSNPVDIENRDERIPEAPLSFFVE